LQSFGACSAHCCSSAEGTGTATVLANGNLLLGSALEWDFDTPGVLQALERFSDQILNNEWEIPSLLPGDEQVREAHGTDEPMQMGGTGLSENSEVISAIISPSQSPYPTSETDALPKVEPEFYYSYSPSSSTSPIDHPTMTPPRVAEPSIITEKITHDFDTYDWNWDSPESIAEDLFPDLKF